MRKAGTMTNSPWAKLIVPDACHSSVQPMRERVDRARCRPGNHQMKEVAQASLPFRRIAIYIVPGKTAVDDDLLSGHVSPAAEARNTAAPAISAGCPQRWRAVTRHDALVESSILDERRVQICVEVTRGDRVAGYANSPSSAASERANPARPAFEDA